MSKLVKQQQQIFLKQEKNNETKLKIIYDLDEAVFLHDLQSYPYLYNKKYLYVISYFMYVNIYEWLYVS